MLVPPGIYLTGSLQLKSNVMLRLDAGAKLQASPHQQDYSQEHPNVVYALNASNTGIEGYGTIDGNGPRFYTKNPDGSIVWETAKMNWRPQEMIRLEKCENVRLKDITFQKSARWTIHIVDSYRVLVQGISVENAVDGPERGPNTDGIGVDASTNVRISDCSIQSGDDCIVLKITDRDDGLKICENVTVTNCTLHSTTSGLKIGSETYGTFRNIAFSNCTIKEGSNGIGLWMRDGGIVDGWTIDNVAMTLTTGQPIYLWSHRRNEETDFGTVRNVRFSDITATGDGGIFMMGNPEQPFEDITFDNIRLHSRSEEVKELHDDPTYPFPIWGYHQNPHDIYVRYAKHLSLQDITFTWAAPEQPGWGSALRLVDVERVKIGGFEGRQVRGSDQAVIQLQDAQGVFIYNAYAPQGTGAFLNLKSNTTDIQVVSSNLLNAERLLHPKSKPLPEKQLTRANNLLPKNE